MLQPRRLGCIQCASPHPQHEGALLWLLVGGVWVPTMRVVAKKPIGVRRGSQAAWDYGDDRQEHPVAE